VRNSLIEIKGYVKYRVILKREVVRVRVEEWKGDLIRRV
jgi:hypothetical protein